MHGENGKFESAPTHVQGLHLSALLLLAACHMNLVILDQVSVN